MKTFHLNKDNDLELEHGQIKMDDKLEAVRTRIDCALQVIKGEVDDDSQGVDYFGIILSNTPISMKVQEISRVIQNLEEVEDVLFERIETDKVNGVLKFYFTINSIYGTLAYDRTFANAS